MSKQQFSFASCEGASLCVPLSSHISTHLYVSEYTHDCVWEFEYAHALCVCVCVCQGKVLQSKGIYKYIYIYIYIEEFLLRHGEYHPPSGKKEEKEKQTFPHPFSFSSSFSILHLLRSAFSISLSVSLTKAAVSSKMRPRMEGMQMKSLLVD